MQTSLSSNPLSSPPLPAQNEDVSEPNHLSATPFQEGWIEPGLFYRGKCPPQSEEWNDADWIYLPHENYIPISKARLLNVLESTFKSKCHENEFEHFTELLEGIYHFRYHRLLNQLKEDYEYFEPINGVELRKTQSSTQLQWREHRFLLNLIHLMIRGNFNPLTAAEQVHAQDHTYLTDLPTQVNLDIHDASFISDFIQYSQTEEGQKSIQNQIGEDSLVDYLQLPPSYENRVLIFHRGITRDQERGIFVSEKLNLWIDRFFQFFVNPVQKSVSTVSHLSKEGASKAWEHRPFAPKTKKSVTLNDPLVSSLNEVNPDLSEEGLLTVHEENVIFLPRWLRRTSLQNQSIHFKNILKESLLQEPAMDKVVAIFRLHPKKPRPWLDAFIMRFPLLHRWLPSEPLAQKDETIYLKLFQHVPLADLEMVFPERSVLMRPFDRFMLYLLGFVGLVLGVYQGMQSHKGIFLMSLSIIGLLGFKTIMRFLNTRRRYMLKLSQDLYQKNKDNDVGVLQYLIDSIEDQEIKEVFLAYFLLWNAGKPLTEKELDEKVEHFLHDQFPGLEVDFEVDDALEKITLEIDEEGREIWNKDQQESISFVPLIYALPTSPTTYQARPLSETLEIMDQKWDSFF